MKKQDTVVIEWPDARVRVRVAPLPHIPWCYSIPAMLLYAPMIGIAGALCISLVMESQWQGALWIGCLACLFSSQLIAGIHHREMVRIAKPLTEGLLAASERCRSVGKLNQVKKKEFADRMAALYGPAACDP